MTDIVVVVLNYKTPDLAVLAAQSAARAMARLGGAIVLVDNASADGSYEAMLAGVRATEWPPNLAVQVLQADRNGGFGAGNNFGVRAGLHLCPSAEFVYILNPDAQVEPEALSALVDYMAAHPKVAIAGSWAHGEDGADHCSAFRFPSLASEFELTIRLGPVTRLLKNHVMPLHVPEASGPVGWVLGASMLIRTEVLRKTGLFDETYFLYFDETELCLRVQRAGYEVHFVRDSRICHIGSVSTGFGRWTRTPSYWFQSRWYYFCKNHNRIYALTATAINALGTALWRLRRKIEGKPVTGARFYIRDMLAHDMRALWRPVPRAQIPPLQTSGIE